MDHAAFSALAHRHHVYCNPVSPEKMAGIVRALSLASGARVVDAGCGKAEILVEIAATYPGVTPVGFDLSHAFLEEGRARVRDRGLAGKVELHEEDASRFRVGEGSLDLAISIGASHLFGGLGPTLETLGTWVRPGGLVLAGEGYWRRPPTPEYLALFGAEEEDFLEHGENVRLAMKLGFTPLGAWTSSEDEWCDYEWLYVRTAERWVEANPGHPDGAEVLRRAHRVRDAHLGGGLETLGFAVYLLRRD